MKPTGMVSVEVALEERTYPVRIGPGLIERRACFEDAVAGDDVMIVTDETVGALYLETLQATLAGWRTQALVLPAGEQHKTLAMFERIIDALADGGLHRDATIVALGGGVVGDMAGFAAACYQRGVALVQVPTTLLAQVDASVGGKTAVNHPAGKNLIGAFHQPLAVVADVRCLETLEERQYVAGLAEVIKYGVGLDRDFFDWLEANMESLAGRDPDAVTEAVRKCCELKAGIVADDEREKGARALLNLGHTFGHAIEAATGYGSWLHGEAVAAGMVMAAQLSVDLECMDNSHRDRLVSLLNRAGLPLAPPPVGAGRMEALMTMDKKVLGGRARLVLLKGLGESFVEDRVPMDTLRRVLEAAGADEES